MAEEQNIWEYYQTEKAGIFEGNHSRVEYLLSFFRGGGKVLNIGVGNGSFERLALAAGLDVYSLDPGEKSVARLRESLRLGEKAAVGSSAAIPFGDSFFDGVVMTEVLEHLEPAVMELTLREVARVLRPGGLFAGTVPCNEDLAAETSVCPKCGEQFHKWGHKQSFTPEGLRAALAARFGTARTEKRLFVPWRTLNWKGKLQGAANHLLFRCGLLGDGRLNIVFRCGR